MEISRNMIFLIFIGHCFGHYDSTSRLLDDYIKINHQIKNVVIHAIADYSISKYFKPVKSLIQNRYVLVKVLVDESTKIFLKGYICNQ